MIGEFCWLSNLLTANSLRIEAETCQKDWAFKIKLYMNLWTWNNTSRDFPILKDLWPVLIDLLGNCFLIKLVNWVSFVFYLLRNWISCETEWNINLFCTVSSDMGYGWWILWSPFHFCLILYLWKIYNYAILANFWNKYKIQW